MDRKALPVPDNLQSDWEAIYVAPRSPIEEFLAGIWAEVLGIEKIGVHDNFFDLGGHSLLTTKVISRLRDSDYFVDLPIRKLFEYPTLEAFAEQVTLTLINEEKIGQLHITGGSNIGTFDDNFLPYFFLIVLEMLMFLL